MKINTPCESTYTKLHIPSKEKCTYNLNLHLSKKENLENGNNLA